MFALTNQVNKKQDQQVHKGSRLGSGQKLYLAATIGALVLGIALFYPSRKATATSFDSELISQSALLGGLAPGAVFPFVDVTPREIARAHIAVTDAAAASGAPANIQVLVGQAGVTLVPVLTAATNTGISTTRGQVVFHVTVVAGVGGVPQPVTDIVVLNGGTAPLSGVNTITVSADVR